VVLFDSGLRKKGLSYHAGTFPSSFSSEYIVRLVSIWARVTFRSEARFMLFLLYFFCAKNQKKLSWGKLNWGFFSGFW